MRRGVRCAAGPGRAPDGEPPRRGGARSSPPVASPWTQVTAGHVALTPALVTLLLARPLPSRPGARTLVGARFTLAGMEQTFGPNGVSLLGPGSPS